MVGNWVGKNKHAGLKKRRVFIVFCVYIASHIRARPCFCQPSLGSLQHNQLLWRLSWIAMRIVIGLFQVATQLANVMQFEYPAAVQAMVDLSVGKKKRKHAKHKCVF